MQSITILQYMKMHGQKLDREIAKDTGIALPQVRLAITKLQGTKAVFSCNVINFDNGVAIEGILCRFSGYFPPAAPGRKPATPAAVA
ncbi:MAG: ArsR family transcriptional regulator [Methylotenera sp.]|nr:ArsR family transcriptional regulator [Methylotenera sp.]